ncbi:hypothetical protein [Leucobacter luti]|uniref:hypothetical protein n=1 Tax=Leucobacter luti TaxID=340320 RepID=UPI003D065E3B
MSSGREVLTHAERAALRATAGDQARVGQSVTPAPDRPLDRRPAIQQWEDVLAVLTWAAGYDRIERGRYEAEAWLEVLRGLAVEDVKNAITDHYRRSRYPVMPADIIQTVEEGQDW